MIKTINITRATVTVVDLTTSQLSDNTVEYNGLLTDKQVLNKVKKLDTDTVKTVTVKSVEQIGRQYELSDDDFIKYATVIGETKPLTRVRKTTE